MMLRSAIVVLIALLVTAVNVAIGIGLNDMIWASAIHYGLPLWWVILIASVVFTRLRLWSHHWTLWFVGILTLIAGEQYFVIALRLVQQDTGLVSILHFVGFTGMFISLLLNLHNQLFPKFSRQHLPLPEEDHLPYVAVVIPTYGEPVDMLEQTMISLKGLDYPDERIRFIVSDDGHRPEVMALAARLGFIYNKGAKKDAKAGNLNSALKLIEEVFPKATLILTQDADEIIDPQFLNILVPYFENPKIAVVQTPKEVFHPQGDPFGTRDRVFYDRIQAGRNGFNAAFACGSGVVWRIEAVKSVGGFCTWNIVEDLTTSYWLHAAGWESEYHNEVLSCGTAPEDIPTLIKQRGTWCADGWRMFLFDNPLWKPGLTIFQRLQYFENGFSYFTTVFFAPMLMLVPFISALTGDFIRLPGEALLAWMGVNYLYFLALAGGNLNYVLRMRQFWDGQAPTYIKGFLVAVGSRLKKPKYKVTQKTRADGFYGGIVWAQFAYLLLGFPVSYIILFIRTDLDLILRLTNVMVVTTYQLIFAGICVASFYGVPLSALLPFGKRAAAPAAEPALATAGVSATRITQVIPLVSIALTLEAKDERSPARISQMVKLVKSQTTSESYQVVIEEEQSLASAAIVPVLPPNRSRRVKPLSVEEFDARGSAMRPNAPLVAAKRLPAAPPVPARTTLSPATQRRAIAHIEEEWRHAEMLEMLEEVKRTREDMAMRGGGD
jgi:cellulose synthase (UDP-forming)